MKKAHNLNTENKLTLNKLKVTKLNNLSTIKGGANIFGYMDNQDGDTWTTISR